MVMVLGKRIKRVFLKNKAKYIGSTFLVMLGCALYIVLNTVSFNLDKNFDNLIEVSNREDAKAILLSNVDNINELEDKFDVTIEERREFDCEIRDGVTLRVFDCSKKVDIPFIVKGSSISKDNDILINPAFGDSQGVNIGDEIKLFGEYFHVSGYMTIPDYIYPTKIESDIIADPNSFGIAVISKNKMKEINKGIETLNIKYNSNSSKKIKEYLDENYKTVFWQDIDDNSRYTMVKAEISGLNEMTLSIPIAIFVITCMLLSTVIWRMVKLEFVEIGTLYAFGYKRREILKHYLTYPLIVAILGAAIGGVLSAFIVGPVLKYYSFYFNLPIINIHYRVKDILLGFIMPIVFLSGACTLVIWRALRLAPVKLMRGHGQKNKIGAIEKRIKLAGYKFKTKFKIREMIRSIPKITIIIIGVAASSMLLLVGFTARDSFDYVVRDGIEDLYKYNYNYVFKTPMVENIYEGERYNAAPFTMKDKKDDIVLYGIEQDSSMVHLKDKAGNRIEGNKIVISKSFAKKFNIRIGDIIDIQNKLNNKKCSVRVDDICEAYIGNFIYMPIEKFNKMLGFDLNTFTGIYSNKKLDIDERILLKAENREDTIKAFDSFIKPMRTLLLGTGVLAFIMALIILYIIISIIIEENKISISMLKVLGYTDRDIGSMVLNTFSLPVIIGYIISIPLLNLSLGKVMASSMKEVDMTMPIIISPINIAIGFIIMYLTYELSKLASRRKVLSISMAESLKAQME